MIPEHLLGKGQRRRHAAVAYLATGTIWTILAPFLAPLRRAHWHGPGSGLLLTLSVGLAYAGFLDRPCAISVGGVWPSFSELPQLLAIHTMPFQFELYAPLRLTWYLDGSLLQWSAEFNIGAGFSALAAPPGTWRIGINFAVFVCWWLLDRALVEAGHASVLRKLRPPTPAP